MIIFRQVNTPKPEGWGSGLHWFVENYNQDGALTDILQVREVLNPPCIVVMSAVSNSDHPLGVMEPAIREKWPAFEILCKN